MSTAAPPKPITPDDLLAMPDGGKGFELVDGELRELIVSRKSSRTAGQIYNRLEIFTAANQPAWVFPEGTSYRCFADDPGRVRRPDTSLILLNRMTAEQYEEDGHCPIVPDLAVEVISPNDLSYEVEGKRDEWLTAGVRTVWIVHPDARTVHVHRADGTFAFLRENDTLTAPDLLPGFSCPVADLFQIPPGP